MTNQIETVKSPEEYLPADQMKEITVSLNDALETSRSMRVVNDESQDEALALAGRIRQKQKGIEAFRVAIVKPIKDHLATIDKFFKALGARFDEPLVVVEEKVDKYRQKKRDAAAKEQEKIAAAAAEGKTIEPKKEAPAKSTYQEGVGRTTFVKDAEFTVENPDLVPDEFWIVDEKKIRSRIGEFKKELEVGKVYKDRIPGVTITSIERPSYAGERS